MSASEIGRTLIELAALLDGRLMHAFAPGLLAAAALAAVLPWVSPQSRISRAVLAGATVALMARYMWWRYAETLPPPSQTLNWASGWAFIIVETMALLSAALSLLFLSGIRDRSAEADANTGCVDERDVPPLIDVLICTYNEERRLLERTIIGAMGMEYRNFRVWVLDDGKREWLRELCESLGTGYITRPGNAHAKAGNINHALDVLAALPDPPEFISIFDADFVPTARFLSRTICLFRDPHVGIVQTPQHFINPDPIQTNLGLAGLWPDEQRYFFDIVLPAKDAWGCAFCCGTSSIMRFAPLRLLGGLPTDSVTEDYLLTLRLAEIGYSTVYLNEPLSFGLAPEGLKEYVTQRGRWCLGFMQIVRGPSGPFSLKRRIHLIERVSLFEAMLNWSFVYLYKFAGILVPMAYLLFGIKAVQVSLTEMLAIFLPYYVVHSGTMSWISRGRVVPILTDVSQILTAPAALKATALGLLSPRGHAFKVTAKGGDRRSRFIELPLLRIFLTLLILAIASVLSGFVFADRHVPINEGALALVWSWYNIAALTLVCFICVEQPRRRRAGRFPTDGSATISVDGLRRAFRMRDISVSGARFAGTAPADIDAGLVVWIDDVPLRANIVRVTGQDFAVRFDDSRRARTALVHHIYSGIHERAIRPVALAPIAQAVLGRLVR